MNYQIPNLPYLLNNQSLYNNSLQQIPVNLFNYPPQLNYVLVPQYAFSPNLFQQIPGQNYIIPNYNQQNTVITEETLEKFNFLSNLLKINPQNNKEIKNSISETPNDSQLRQNEIIENKNSSTGRAAKLFEIKGQEIELNKKQKKNFIFIKEKLDVKPDKIKNNELDGNTNNNNTNTSSEKINSNIISSNNNENSNEHPTTINNTTDPNNNQAKLKYFRCTFKDCDKVFPKECNLRDHIRTHTGEKPFKCSFPGCAKSFSQHGNLKKHEKVHLGDKKFICNYPGCGKKFSASYNLKIHYRSHTGERPYKCNFENCDRAFYDKGNLKYHEKTMHMIDSNQYPYSCEHMGCNAKFKTVKEKLEHHYKMENDCLVEKQELLKLIQKYKILLKYIVKEENINVEEDENILKLKKLYNEIQNKSINKDSYIYYLGENFDADCNHVEDINIKDDDKKTEISSLKND